MQSSTAAIITYSILCMYLRVMTAIVEGQEHWSHCGELRTGGKPNDVWLTFLVGLFRVKVHPLQGQRKGCQQNLVVTVGVVIRLTVD